MTQPHKAMLCQWFGQTDVLSLCYKDMTPFAASAHSPFKHLLCSVHIIALWFGRKAARQQLTGRRAALVEVVLHV